VGVSLLNALLFVINIATTTGYQEQMVYNNYERLFFIFFIYIGDALFAFGFGLMSSATDIFSEKFEKGFEFLRRIQQMKNRKMISHTI